MVCGVGQGKSDGAGAFAIVAEAIGQFLSGMPRMATLAMFQAGVGCSSLLC
jgi:hypothetical protein